MKTGLTPSERFVASLCARSFLRLWTHPNPKGKKGKELCDCLIVCGPHIVIISVKENEYRETGDVTGWERWTKAAIEESASQIWGAERWLETVDSVEHHDGRIIALPQKGLRHYHRIAVALGGRGQVPLQWGDFGNGFVHVCEEYSIEALFTALDTITDFVEFLDASETLIRSGTQLHFAGGGIEDLVGLYITNGRTFKFEDCGQKQPNALILLNDLWQGLLQMEDFKQMQLDFKESYIWDNFIEFLANDLLAGRMFDMHSKEITQNELALVTMAIEPRENRAVLGKAFKEFLEKTDLRSAARVVRGRPGVAFVFTVGSSKERDSRVQKLTLRCLVVRGRLPNIHTVVGIATDRPGTSEIGYSSDVVYLHMPEWTEVDEKNVEGIQRELGYFKKTNWSTQRTGL